MWAFEAIILMTIVPVINSYLCLAPKPEYLVANLPLTHKANISMLLSEKWNFLSGNL